MSRKRKAVDGFNALFGTSKKKVKDVAAESKVCTSVMCSSETVIENDNLSSEGGENERSS